MAALRGDEDDVLAVLRIDEWRRSLGSALRPYVGEEKHLGHPGEPMSDQALGGPVDGGVNTHQSLPHRPAAIDDLHIVSTNDSLRRPVSIEPGSALVRIPDSPATAGDHEQGYEMTDRKVKASAIVAAIAVAAAIAGCGGSSSTTSAPAGGAGASPRAAAPEPGAHPTRPRAPEAAGAADTGTDRLSSVVVAIAASALAVGGCGTQAPAPDRSSVWSPRIWLGSSRSGSGSTASSTEPTRSSPRTTSDGSGRSAPNDASERWSISSRPMRGGSPPCGRSRPRCAARSGSTRTPTSSKTRT